MLQLKKMKDQSEGNKKSAGKTKHNSGETSSNPSNIKNANKSRENDTKNRNDSITRTVDPPCDTYGKTNHTTEQS